LGDVDYYGKPISRGYYYFANVRGCCRDELYNSKQHAKKYYYHTVLAVAGKYNIRDSKSNAPF
jgi:hypothetical protein